MKTKIRILIVDDDLIIRLTYSKILQHKGFEVVTSETAVDIISTIAKYNPDLVLMDQQMPVVTGYEAIKKIRADEVYQHIPIVFFSSVTNLATLADEAGADSYLLKSSSPDQVSDVIEHLVGKVH